MAKQNLINIFDLDNAYAGGGEFFKDGRYSCDEGGAFFTMFDFFGKAKAGEEAPALCLELQALDENGKTVGEPKPQFWPVRGKGVELANPIRGKKGAFAGLVMGDASEFDTLMKGGEFFMFMESLRKAEFDFDQYDNDITVLGGNLDAQFGKKPDPYDVEKRKNADPADKKAGDKKDYGPRMIVVVTELVDAKPAGKGKDKKEAKEEKEEKSSKSEKSSGKAPKSAKAFLIKYVEDELDGAKEKEETTRPLVRMEIAAFIKELGGDADMVKEVQALVNDDDALAAVLDSFGWSLKGKAITPPKG